MSETKVIPHNGKSILGAIPGIGALVTIDGSNPVLALGDRPLKERPIGLISDYAAWGPNNQEPQDTIAAIRKNTLLGPALLWKANTLVSGGLAAGYVKFVNDKEVFTPIQDKDIENFLRRSAVHRFVREAALEYYTHWNLFARFRINASGKVAGVDCLNTCDVRLSNQDAKDGSIKKAYVYANFDQTATPSIAEIKLKYDLIDPYFDWEEQIKNLPKGVKEFVYPVQGPDYDYTYYAKSPWNGLRESGWLDIMEEIPKFKKSLLKRQFSFKYHIRLSRSYYEKCIPDYEKIKNDPDKLTAANQTLLSDLNAKLAGSEQAGSNLMSVDDFYPGSKDPIPGVTITPIDDKIKDGIYIEDSQEAAMHLYGALGIDGTLVSSIPGKTLSGGSGSDKRVAMNIYLQNCKPDMDLLLEPLRNVFLFNGWGKQAEDNGGLQLWFRNYWISTLDENKNPQQMAK